MQRIGLAVVVAVGVILAPVIAETQPAGKAPRIGYLVLPPLAEKPSPERAAFVAGLRERAGSRERRLPSSTARRNRIPSCSTTSPKSWSG